MNHNGGADEIVNSTEWRCRWWFRLTTEVISSPYVYDKWKLLHSHVFHLFIATYQNNTTIYTTGLFCSACTFSLMKNITLFACTLFFLLNLISLVSFCYVRFLHYTLIITLSETPVLFLYTVHSHCPFFLLYSTFAKLYNVHDILEDCYSKKIDLKKCVSIKTRTHE